MNSTENQAIRERLIRQHLKGGQAFSSPIDKVLDKMPFDKIGSSS